MSTVTFPLGLSCAAEEALLDGANPVPESYFTATGYWSGRDPLFARLSATSHWAPSSEQGYATPPSIYLQVRQAYIIQVILLLVYVFYAYNKVV